MRVHGENLRIFTRIPQLHFIILAFAASTWGFAGAAILLNETSVWLLITGLRMLAVSLFLTPLCVALGFGRSSVVLCRVVRQMVARSHWSAFACRRPSERRDQNTIVQLQRPRICPSYFP